MYACIRTYVYIHIYLIRDREADRLPVKKLQTHSGGSRIRQVPNSHGMYRNPRVYGYFVNVKK